MLDLLPVLPKIYRWRQPPDRPGGFERQGYLIGEADERRVLIDPLAIGVQEAQALGTPRVVLLTGAERQRAAWKARREWSLHVFAPEGAEGLEEEPDYAYSAGESLPGGLVAFHAPGPSAAAHALWLFAGPRGVVFLGGLMVHDGRGIPRVAPELADPARARLSVERILQRLPVEALLFQEGEPILQDGARALRAALADGGAQQPSAP